jgi:hypothetical protein
MLISTTANAAEALVQGEDARFYDDIGCLAKDPTALGASTERFVRLANRTGWAATESAWFALAPGANTPMAHGVFAFATEAEARAGDRAGRARKWDEIVREMGGS